MPELNIPTGPRMPGGARRVIGPIPPRDEKGRLKLKPLPGKSIKTNALGEPIRDKDGNPIEETADLRDFREYLAYEHGHENQIADGATKGLKLYQIDLVPDPIYLVYARDEADALAVFRREAGIIRFGERDPRVTPVPPAGAPTSSIGEKAA